MTSLHAGFAATDGYVDPDLSTFLLTDLRPNVAAAVARLRAGRTVIVGDSGDSADVVFAAQFATSELINEMLHHTGGYICAAMTGERAEALGLPGQYRSHPAPGSPRYCVSVDASDGVSTGISAADRARTLRLLADGATHPDDLTRPGHVVPATVDLLRTRRQTGSELRMSVAVILCLTAGVYPVAAISTLLNHTDLALGAGPSGCTSMATGSRCLGRRHPLDLTLLRRVLLPDPERAPAITQPRKCEDRTAMTITASTLSTAAPVSTSEWLAQAANVAGALRADALERDRANAVPTAEVELLKQSGLVTLLGPIEHGGGGQSWTTALQVVRIVAAADGSIGQLLGYHYLWAWAARLVGTPEQIAAVEQQATEENWFFGGAVNPRDNDLVITEDGDELVFNGRKSFSTGARVADAIVLEGVIDGTDKHVFAIVPAQQPGIRFQDDWDNLGQRLTVSGGVGIDNIRVPWAAAAGYVDREFQPRVYNTLNVPLIQLVFVNFYLGIAQGGLQTAAAYTRDVTRPWPFAADVRERAVDEFYVQETYGALQTKVWAAEALAERAAGLIEAINSHADSVTEAERGEAEVVIAAAKVAALDAGLDVGTRIFEVTGARATSNSVGLDIFWRNLRTHSLHDPIAHKRAEIGRYALTGELPEPTWYT